MIIGILNQKGGVGKTTLATNIGKCLQLMGHKVLVIDTDHQYSALKWHAASEGKNLPVIGITGATIKKDVASISSGYDYIIIDGAGRLDNNKPTIGALMCADIVLLPIKPSSFDKSSTSEMLSLIDEVQLMRDIPLRFSLILNECKINTLSMRTTEEECKERDLPLFKSRTFDREDYINCLGAGLTVLDAYPSGKAAKEIREITNELLEFIK